MNYIKYIIMLTIITVLLVFNLPAFALDIEIGRETMTGYTNYEIYDNSYSWKSKLEFPLDTDLIKIKNTFLNINTTFKFNQNNKNDLLFKDSDWIGSDFSETPDMYSEAKSQQIVLIADINTNLGKFIINDYVINYGFGFQNKYFKYSIYDAVIKDHENNDNVFINGEVLKYYVKYHIPYLELKYKTTYDNLELEVNCMYSFWVKAFDYDNHILRDKTSKSTTNGNGGELSARVKYNIIKGLSINADYSKDFFNTTGYQTQEYNGRIYDNIISNIHMDSTSYSLSLNYNF